MSRRFPDVFLTRPRFAESGREREERPAPSLPTAPTTRPFATFTPEGYEPNYAYPLVIWFHDAGEDERVLHRVMRQMSDRNAIGLALRGERVRRGGGYDWAVGGPEAREHRLVAAARSMRREHNVHTERIVLAGRGSGAAAAAGLFFARPASFGGLALFDAPTEALPAGPLCGADLAGKPVLLDLPTDYLGRGRDGASRLAASGLDVTLRHTRPGGVCAGTLRHLDRWLLASVCGVSM